MQTIRRYRSKTLLMAALLAAAFPAYAMNAMLVAQWIEGGNQMCRYDNGTVLNVGYKSCPMSIPG